MKRLKYSQAKQAAKQFFSINYFKLFVHLDLMTHYSLDILLINVAFGAFCHPFSMGEGWWCELWPWAWVILEILGLIVIYLCTDIYCL